MTLIVIVATLVAQGLTLEPLLRRARPDGSGRGSTARTRSRASRPRRRRWRSSTESAERHGLPEESRNWLEREYAFRSRQYGARADKPAATTASRSASRRMAAADSELLEAARDAVMELAARGEVRAEVAQEVLRDLDLDNARISEPEKTGPA